MISWLEEHPVTATLFVAFIAAIPALIAVAVSAWRFASDHRQAHRQQRFENYHRLINELVQGREGQKHPKLDSQIAIIFELRNYKEYGDLTRRLIDGLRSTWPETNQNSRLHLEMRLTEAALVGKRPRTGN